jgi:hypothetical protein
MRVPTPSPPLQEPGGLALSDSEKAKALADSLETQFQPVNDPSVPAVIEMVNEAMRTYVYAPASEPKLISPSEVLHTIMGLKVGKAPGPNGTPIRVLRHVPKRAITFLTKVFNAVLRRQYFPQHGNTQELSNLAGDDVWRLRNTPPLVSFMVGWLVGCLARCLLIALMMEAARTSDTLVNFYQTTRRYNPEDSHLHLQ